MNRNSKNPFVGYTDESFGLPTAHNSSIEPGVDNNFNSDSQDELFTLPPEARSPAQQYSDWSFEDLEEALIQRLTAFNNEVANDSIDIARMSSAVANESNGNARMCSEGTNESSDTAPTSSAAANESSDTAPMSSEIANDSNGITRTSSEVANHASGMAGQILEATTDGTSVSPPAKKRNKRSSSPKAKATKAPRASKAPKAPKVPKASKASKAPKTPKAPKVPKSPPKGDQQHQQTSLLHQNLFTWNAAAIAPTLQGFGTAAPIYTAENPFLTQGLQPMPIPSALGEVVPMQSFHNTRPPMSLQYVPTYPMQPMQPIQPMQLMQPMQPMHINPLPMPSQQVLGQPVQPCGSFNNPIDLTSETSMEEESTELRSIPVECSDLPDITDSCLLNSHLWETEYGTQEWWWQWKIEEPHRPQEYIDAYREEWVEVPRV
ncbi:MAG: hypothetical protein Q9167_005174 [Letrouitia subvulpina]